MHRIVRCKLEHRCWRVRGEDESFTDVKIKIPWGCEWRHSPEARAEDFGRFWKKSVSWELDSEEGRWLSFARRSQASGLVVGAARDGMGGSSDGKVIIERLSISLPYVETFNSKVIKGFVPELRSRVFRVSGFQCSMYMCYEHSMYISHIRIMAIVHSSFFQIVSHFPPL